MMQQRSFWDQNTEAQKMPDKKNSLNNRSIGAIISVALMVERESVCWFVAVQVFVCLLHVVHFLTEANLQNKQYGAWLHSPVPADYLAPSLSTSLLACKH